MCESRRKIGFPNTYQVNVSNAIAQSHAYFLKIQSKFLSHYSWHYEKNKQVLMGNTCSMKCFLQNWHGKLNFRAEDVLQNLYQVDGHVCKVEIPIAFPSTLPPLKNIRQFIKLIFGRPIPIPNFFAIAPWEDRTTMFVQDHTNFMWNATFEVGQMIVPSQFVDGWCNLNFDISIMTRGQVFSKPKRMMQEHPAKW